MKDVLPELAKWSERGDRIALATVIAAVADDVLRGGEPQLLHFGITDSEAWDVGLPCGGEIDVWVQAYELERFEEIAREDGRAAEVTLLQGPRPGAKLLVEADGTRSGSLGAPELDDEGARAAAELLWPEEAFARLGGIDPATSRRAHQSRRERLIANGTTEAELARLAAPLGLDLGAVSSDETALSILAEVVAARHGREGGRLADSRGRIHEVAA